MIERRSARVLPSDYGPPGDPRAGLGCPLVESTWIEPYPDARFGVADAIAGPEARYEQREAVELAFIAALQHQPARQRSALILRDVLGYSGGEVAEALDTTAASVYSLLQRAHATLDQRLPDRSQQATLRTLGDEQLSAIVNRYVLEAAGTAMVELAKTPPPSPPPTCSPAPDYSNCHEHISHAPSEIGKPADSDPEAAIIEVCSHRARPGQLSRRSEID
jgi:DNA-directed RNA polymerase specialized sigma24 family protein